MPRFVITLEGRDYVSREFVYTPWIGLGTSRVYISPHTGNTWAKWRLVSPHPGHANAHYSARLRAAPGEPSWNLCGCPGIMHESLADLFILPPELLQRELLHIVAKDNYMNDIQNRWNSGEDVITTVQQEQQNLASLLGLETPR